jgi:hypothetical protein
MALCIVCDALTLEKDDDTNLGAYDDMLFKAGEGCGGCKFFCDILHTSSRWKDKQSELGGHIVFLHSQRLDVKKPENITGSTWSCDDLLFDYCVSEDDTGRFSL